jgi:spermidine synthase
MALPLAAAVLASPARAGREVGLVFAANTGGAIAGALGAGLALLPSLGAPRTLAALAAAQSLAGAGLLRKRKAALAVPALCACALLLPREPFVHGFLQASRGGERAAEVLAFHEGATDTVAVVRKDYGFHDPQAKSILVNGIAMTATVKPVWRYMAAEGHLPALLAPDPGKALVLCVGTGITLGSLLATPGVTRVDAVDLSEGILQSLPLFARENRGAFADPRVTLHRADGRHFLETTRERYGLITLEPPPPIVAGAVHLYTLDFYRLCRRHLLPGGVVAQWLPLHGQSLGSARATARTFLEAFPHAQLWLPSIRDAVLLGSERPLSLAPARLQQAYASTAGRESLAAAYLETPEALLATYLLDREGIADWCAGADLVTDDRPRLEFFRPYGANMEDREIGTLLEIPPAEPIPVPGLGERVARERAAMRLYLRSEVQDDVAAAREAARTSRGTRFFLYRLGCDPTQLATLERESSGGPAFQAQARRCAEFVTE